MERKFKVLSTHDTVPYWIIKEHESQCFINHGQSVDTLNSRGGLAYSEILNVLLDRKGEWKQFYKSEEAEAYERECKAKVWQIIKSKGNHIPMVQLDDGNYVPEAFCTFTNPRTTPSGESEVDDVEYDCFDENRCISEDGEPKCKDCVIQKIFNDYALQIKGVIL